MGPKQNLDLKKLAEVDTVEMHKSLKQSTLAQIKQIQQNLAKVGMHVSALPEDKAQHYMLAVNNFLPFHVRSYNFLPLWICILQNFPFSFKTIRSMQMGAILNSKGWSFIAKGLGQLEVGTAGADLPQLWKLFETFFGCVDEDLGDTSSQTS